MSGTLQSRTAMAPLLPSGAVQTRCASRGQAQVRCISRGRLSPTMATRAEPCLAPQRARAEALSLEKLPHGSQGQTGLLIWFHGLGMSGSEFGEELEKGIAMRMPWLQLHYPDAAYQAVTSRDGEQMRAWFDLEELPVRGVGVEHSGLPGATVRVHEMIRQAEASGIPASRIVLAGFSQGGVLALQAGLTYDRALAGIAAFSSWLPANLHKEAKHKDTPVFMGHGSEDSAVPFPVGLASYKALEDNGFTRTGFSKYKDLRHCFAGEQWAELEAFVLRELPKVHKGPLRQISMIPQPVKAPFKPQRERIPSSDSTEEGSSSDDDRKDSPPTTDDEVTEPVRLRHSGLTSLRSLTAAHGARSVSPQASWARKRVLTSGPARRQINHDSSLAKTFVAVNRGCASPCSSHKALGQKSASKDASAAALAFFPQHASTSPKPSGAFREIVKSQSFSCQAPGRGGACTPSPSMCGLKPSFVTSPCNRSPSRLQRGCTRSQNWSFQPPTSSLASHPACSVKLIGC